MDAQRCGWLDICNPASFGLHCSQNAFRGELLFYFAEQLVRYVLSAMSVL
jgi:hypothetical protein